MHWGEGGGGGGGYLMSTFTVDNAFLLSWWEFLILYMYVCMYVYVCIEWYGIFYNSVPVTCACACMYVCL